MESGSSSPATPKRRFLSLPSRTKALPPPSKPQEQNNRCFFFTLPLELRLNIYNILLEPVYTKGFNLDPLNTPGYDVQTPAYGAHPLYPLLFVSRSLRSEVATVIYTGPARTLRFGSPHQCLFFLTWTSSHLDLLSSLYISVSHYSVYALEAIFKLIIRAESPLQRLTLDFEHNIWLNACSEPAAAPMEEHLWLWRGKEMLNEARRRAMKLNFDETLDPNRSYLPREQRAQVEDRCVSSLGQINTLRYLAMENMGIIGIWAMQFELGVLRVQAKMFATAAQEGRKMMLKPGINRWQKLISTDIATSSHYTTFENAHWVGSAFWIEGTVMDGKGAGMDDIVWMGKYDNVPLGGKRTERKFPSLRKALGMGR